MPQRRKSKLAPKKNQQDAAHRRRHEEAEARRLFGQQVQQPATAEQHVEDDGASEPEAEVAQKAGHHRADVSQPLVESQQQRLSDREEKEVQAAPEVKETGVQVKPSFQDVSVEAKPEFCNVQTEAKPEVCNVQTEATVSLNSVGVDAQDILMAEIPLKFMDLFELNSRIARDLPADWKSCFRDSQIHIFQLTASPFISVTKTVVVSSSGVEIFVLGRHLIGNHSVWSFIDENCKRSSSSVFEHGRFILEIIQKVGCLVLRGGITDVRFEELFSKGVFGIRGHVEIDSHSNKKTYHSKSCMQLIDSDVCVSCKRELRNMVREINRKIRRESQDRDTSKINLRYIEKNELLIALQASRTLNSKYIRTINSLKSKLDHLIETKGEVLDKAWSKDFQYINKKNFDKMTPLQKLFWDQQLQALSYKNRKSMKWHPMMIRLAMHLQSAGSSSLRDSPFITLPSKRTMYDYTNALDPVEGCQKEILSDLLERFKDCTEDEKFVNLMFDEMHIKSNLVYQKSSGELIGYAKLDELETEFQNLISEWSGKKPAPKLAKKVLVYMIRNISANDDKKKVKGIVAVYSTSASMTAAGLYTRTWDVIYCLEASGILVLVLTCDGASTNRTFIKMHAKFDENDEFVYRTINLASGVFRILYFNIDDPHLLKTSRNCFANSGRHEKNLKLWKNGETISWSLIESYYERHKSDKFRKCLLSSAHVYLTSFSLMNVSFAAKVLCKTLSEAIKEEAEQALSEGKSYPCYKEAIKYMRWLNDVFDCMNGHNVTSHIRFKNDHLKPYSTQDDERFNLLQDFIKYLEEWEEEVRTRPGNFSKTQRKQMIISEQTRSGWKITISSFIDSIKFLIDKGAKEICARRFTQDPLEQAFSIFRRMQGSNNMPDLQQVLKSRNVLHAQKEVAIPSSSGNTLVEKEEMTIDSSVVRKRARNT